MGYSPASDELNVGYLWVRKQDLDGGIVWMGQSNPAPLSLKALTVSALLPFHLQVQKSSHKKLSNQMEKE